MRAKSTSCWLFLLLLLQPLLALADTAATVVFATGSPMVSAASGLSRALLRGGTLVAGDTIDTADGRVQLRFADGASMSLQPGSHFRIDAFRFVDRGNRASAGDGVAMTLIKGALRTVSGLLGKEDRSQYSVGTSVATIGIRGTEYGATMDGSGLSVSTYAGLVEVCSAVACQQIGPGETVWVYDRAERPQLQARALPMPGVEVQPELPQTPTGSAPAQPVAAPTVAPLTAPVNSMPNNRSPGTASYGK